MDPVFIIGLHDFSICYDITIMIILLHVLDDFSDCFPLRSSFFFPFVFGVSYGRLTLLNPFFSWPFHCYYSFIKLQNNSVLELVLPFPIPHGPKIKWKMIFCHWKKFGH